jgi:hypothetical protein
MIEERDDPPESSEEDEPPAPPPEPERPDPDTLIRLRESDLGPKPGEQPDD